MTARILTIVGARPQQVDISVKKNIEKKKSSRKGSNTGQHFDDDMSKELLNYLILRSEKS